MGLLLKSYTIALLQTVCINIVCVLSRYCNSTYRESGYIRTTPAAPTNVSAKQSGNNIAAPETIATGSVTGVEKGQIRSRKAPGEGSYEDLVELGKCDLHTL